MRVSSDRATDGKHKETIIHTTKHRSGNLSPKYEEAFCYDLSPYHSPSIEFGIFDYDAMSAADPMGHVVINVFDLIVQDAKVRCGEERSAELKRLAYGRSTPFFRTSANYAAASNACYKHLLLCDSLLSRRRRTGRSTTTTRISRTLRRSTRSCLSQVRTSACETLARTVVAASDAAVSNVIVFFFVFSLRSSQVVSTRPGHSPCT